MENPLFKREAKKNSQSKAYRRAPKQEKELAKRARSWRTPGSGNGKIKGDVQVVGLARIECKCTQKKSFSVTREMIEKIENAGLGAGEVPFIHVEFIDEKGKPECEVAVIPMHALERLLSNADSA